MEVLLVVAHDTSIKYKSEHLKGVNLPAGWTVGRHDEGTYWASGPCICCGGDAYGPTLPDLAPAGDTRELREVVASVRADCRCGDDHGQEGSGGCGRYWTVRVESRGSNK